MDKSKTIIGLVSRIRADINEWLWRGFIIFWLVGLFLIVILLFNYGWRYYRLPYKERPFDYHHDILRSSGVLGHTLSIVGAVMIATNFTYLLRKKGKIFTSGSLEKWLDVHMLAGLSGWVLLSFHSSFHISRILAIAYYGLALVVITGLLGRYIYAHIPKHMGGHIKNLRQLNAEYERFAVQLRELKAPLNEITNIINKEKYLSVIKGKKGISLLPVLLKSDLIYLYNTHMVHIFIKKFYHSSADQSLKEVWEITREMAKRSYWIALLKSVQNLMSKWRAVHKFFAWTLVILFFIHLILVYLFVGKSAFIGVFKNFKIF